MARSSGRLCRELGRPECTHDAWMNHFMHLKGSFTIESAAVGIWAKIFHIESEPARVLC